MSIDSSVFGDAAFDETRTYRYSLTRRWDSGSGSVCWIMLNPSTADERVLDPTIRRCVQFSRSWGYDGLEVVNAFAYRSTDPKKMFAFTGDIIGRDNDEAIFIAMERNQLCIAAWGANIAKRPGREDAIIGLACDAGASLMALKISSTGRPYHPLYLPGDLTPIEYRKANQ